LDNYQETTHFVFNKRYFSQNLAFYEVIQKHRAIPDRPHWTLCATLKRSDLHAGYLKQYHGHTLVIFSTNWHFTD